MKSRISVFFSVSPLQLIVRSLLFTLGALVAYLVYSNIQTFSVIARAAKQDSLGSSDPKFVVWARTIFNYLFVSSLILWCLVMAHVDLVVPTELSAPFYGFVAFVLVNWLFTSDDDDGDEHPYCSFYA